MPVKITYMIENVGNTGLPGTVSLFSTGVCIAAETLTLGATGAHVAGIGEIALIVSTEAATIIAAHGTTPDATAVARTSLTGAGYAIPPNVLYKVVLREGDMIDTAAFA